MTAPDVRAAVTPAQTPAVTLTDPVEGDVFTVSNDGALVTLTIASPDGDYRSMYITPAQWSAFLETAAL